MHARAPHTLSSLPLSRRPGTRRQRRLTAVAASTVGASWMVAQHLGRVPACFHAKKCTGADLDLWNRPALPGGARDGGASVPAWPPRLASLSAEGVAKRQAGLQDYSSLKRDVLKNTGLFGAGLSVYLLLAQHDLAVAGSALAGTGGSVAYVALLCRHVDALGPGVRSLPPVKGLATNLGAVAVNAVKRIGDVYWNALARPQLLVPVALAVASTAWNDAHDPAADVSYVYLLLGFLSYKVAALDQTYRALKQVTLYAAPVVERPTLAELPDIEDPL
jgi:hypothetical protein